MAKEKEDARILSRFKLGYTREVSSLRKILNKEELLIIKYHNLITTFLGILVAILILRSPEVHNFISEDIHNYSYLGAFLAGLFFTSGFTTVPTIAVIALMGDVYSPFMIAFIGAFGSLVGDLFIFTFLRKKLLKDIKEISKKEYFKEFKKKALSKWLNRFAPVIVGFIIASPLPDELAIVILSYSNISENKFMIYSYVFNFLGILSIAYLGRTLF